MRTTEDTEHTEMRTPENQKVSGPVAAVCDRRPIRVIRAIRVAPLLFRALRGSSSAPSNFVYSVNSV